MPIWLEIKAPIYPYLNPLIADQQQLTYLPQQRELFSECGEVSDFFDYLLYIQRTCEVKGLFKIWTYNIFQVEKWKNNWIKSPCGFTF